MQVVARRWAGRATATLREIERIETKPKPEMQFEVAVTVNEAKRGGIIGNEAEVEVRLS
ncbi:UNVERIFIED_CONTAM: hypothetical protein Slati_4509400 [Sesamum latifolium]|uniref:Uncharacterized protein n=1 Tax=Sesamum latifolium TaxID=2727402 RepID=A0AAW2SSK6_9LAMI